MTRATDIESCFDRGWSDGLPVVPPYREVVDEMLNSLGWAGTDVVAELPKFNLEVRADQLAATAVMAGCHPSYGRVLRQVAQAVLDPLFDVTGVAVTTGGVSITVIVSGPVVHELGFAHGSNALGGSTRVNATVGRFAGLLQRFCGLAAGQLEEFGTLGHPGRLSFCVAEHPETVWSPFHTQVGIEKDCSAVTVMATEGPNSVNNHYAETADHILETIAGTIVHVGTTSMYYQSGGYVIVIAPEHMSLISEEYGRDEARARLAELAVQPTDHLIRIGRIPTDHQPLMKVEPGKPRSPFWKTELLTFLETGGSAGKFSAVIPGWVGNKTVARTIPAN